MFLIAELPEFTEIRLIYQTKKSLAVFEMAYLLTAYCVLPSTRCILPTIFFKEYCVKQYTIYNICFRVLCLIVTWQTNINSAQLSRLLPYKQMC